MIDNSMLMSKCWIFLIEKEMRYSKYLNQTLKIHLHIVSEDVEFESYRIRWIRCIITETIWSYDEYDKRRRG